MFIKRLPRFEYHAPASIPEALELLSRYGSDAKLLAGGTDLILAMKKRSVPLSHLINLKTIPGLYGIEADGEGVTIGPLTTIAEIERSSVIRETYWWKYRERCSFGGHGPAPHGPLGPSPDYRAGW